MTRRDFLAASATTLAAQESAPRPNIIFIYADDLDFDEIDCYDIDRMPCTTGAVRKHRIADPVTLRAYRDPRMLTPNIRSMARDGVTFSRFYVTTPICTPSRYSTLTGQYASRSPEFLKKYPPGSEPAIRWDTNLSPGQENLPRALRRAGYRTGMAGKWHNGMEASALAGLPPDADPYDSAVNSKLRQWYEAGRKNIQERAGWDFCESAYFNNKEQLGLPTAMQVHNLDWIGQGAVDFIDKAAKDPFFLYVPITVPHSQYVGEWVKENPLFTPSGVLDRLPTALPGREDLMRRVKEAGIDPRNAPATWIDDMVGAIMKALDRNGVSDNTLLIFSSDHQSRGKDTCFESCRVPFIARWPKGIPAGATADALTANIDLMPTFLELAGAETPSQMDGSSLIPLLRGQGKPPGWRRSLLLETSHVRAAVGEEWKYIANRPPREVWDKIEADAADALKTGRKRYVALDGVKNPHAGFVNEGIRYWALADFPHYFDRDQLYHLGNDVFEQDNLAGDPSYTKQLGAMKEELGSLLAPLPHNFAEFKRG